MLVKRASLIFFIIVPLMLFCDRAFSDSLNAYDILYPKEKKISEYTIVFHLVKWYQKNVSPLNGSTCMFYPTCSDYFRQTVSKYGAIQGIIMTIDRMFYRENNKSMKYYPYLPKYDRFYDPPENHVKF